MWHRLGFTIVAALCLTAIAFFVRGVIALYGAIGL